MLHHVIAMGAGREAADLLLTNARLVNVFSGDIETTHVAVGHGVIVGIGREYRRAKQAYDLAGKYLLPGLIDGHVHLESSLLSAVDFSICCSDALRGAHHDRRQRQAGQRAKGLQNHVHTVSVLELPHAVVEGRRCVLLRNAGYEPLLIDKAQ